MKNVRRVPGVGAALLAALILPACASVHTETVIPASQVEVWAVLTDADGYEEWNPVFVDAQGQYREGETLTYRMRGPEGEESEVKATVVTLRDQRELNQRGGVWGILTFDHY